MATATFTWACFFLAPTVGWLLCTLGSDAGIARCQSPDSAGTYFTYRFTCYRRLSLLHAESTRTFFFLQLGVGMCYCFALKGVGPHCCLDYGLAWLSISDSTKHMLTYIHRLFLFTTIYNVGLLFFLTVCYVHCYCCTIVFPWEYLCRVALTYLNLIVRWCS